MQSSPSHTAAEAVNWLSQQQPLLGDELLLGLPGLQIGIRSNSAALLERLADYFRHVLVNSGQADVMVDCYDGAVRQLPVSFVDWRREPGKTGRKDAIVELADGRLVQKVRTGMVFLQSTDHRIAAGPCLDYDNQVINFINAQYMNHLQQQGELICHAACLVGNNRALALAGFSGGGKSTLMLHLLAQPGSAYLTNDRLFLARDQMMGQVIATGIPKLPRVNPGTIVHDEKLRAILTEQRLAELEAMPAEELWHLEEKYDVDVLRVYGPGHIVQQAPLSALLILHWTRESTEPMQIQAVDLNQRPELLPAVMKSPGPFYQFADGHFLTDDMVQDPAPYLELLQDVTVYEATGKVDFAAAVDWLEQQVLNG